MVRIMIVLLVLGSGFLGWTAYKQDQRLDYLRKALAKGGLVPKTAANIQQNSENYAMYKDRAASDGLKDADPGVYIQSAASNPNVNIGRVDYTPGSKEHSRGIVDRTFRIEPNDRKAQFPRLNIANFLYKLEEDSRRVKVTMVDLSPSTKVGEGERPQDLWKLTAEISIRERKATSPNAR